VVTFLIHPNLKLRPLLQNSNVGSFNDRGFVEVLAASQSGKSKNWFQGTADAVRQYLWLFDEAVRDGVEDFLILSGQQTL
jgi:glucose-1-phosphate adenylyltransferase